MEELFDFFVNHLSVGQMISYCCDEAGDTDSAINAAIDVEPLYTPEFLARKYYSRVSKAKRLKSQQKDALNSIIKKSTETNFINHHREIFEPIFGADLDRLLRHSQATLKPQISDKSILDRNLLELTEEIIDELLNTTPAPLRGLPEIIPDFEIVIAKDPGFAEYWPRSLTGNDMDQLIVYDNPNQIGYQNLRATIGHEVLGHGFFYNLIERIRPEFFDHGAFALVEGWATWCEWATCDADLRDHLRSAKCQSLKLFDCVNPDEIQDQIKARTSGSGYTKDVSESSIENFFQYPGMGLSYTLGALWFEDRFKSSSPRVFFEAMRQREWGDFFSAW
ncbi:hypothetical protein [Microbulbifer elongatus]|uniref:hypothetical protein n=1 Tax=Microbulbifer elongatus TaxID=86173 RepID=UPI001CFDDF6B|nr:hypothetical protein [Microbulbifer elongatus]